LKIEDEFEYVEGNENHELGAVFKVNNLKEEEFLLKIIITPSNKIAFQIALQSEKPETEEFAKFAL